MLKKIKQQRKDVISAIKIKTKKLLAESLYLPPLSRSVYYRARGGFTILTAPLGNRTQ